MNRIISYPCALCNREVQIWNKTAELKITNPKEKREIVWDDGYHKWTVADILHRGKQQLLHSLITMKEYDIEIDPRVLFERTEQQYIDRFGAPMEMLLHHEN